MDQIWNWKLPLESRESGGSMAIADRTPRVSPDRNKDSRWRALCEVIESQPVRTQQELRRLLAERGFQVSQITVSRDLEQLEIVRVREWDGSFRYRSSKLRTGAVSVREYFVDHAVVVASDPEDLAQRLNRAQLPGVIEAVPQARTVWVAATQEGLARLRLFLKKGRPESGDLRP